MTQRARVATVGKEHTHCHNYHVLIRIEDAEKKTMCYLLILLFSSALGNEARRWFREHVVGETSRKPAFGERLQWPAGDAFRELAQNLTTHSPNPRLTYIIVRGRGENASNVDGWNNEHEEIAEWIESPKCCDQTLLKEFANSVESSGGALVIRDVERIAWVRKAARRAAHSMGRTVWGHDQVNIFHTFQAQTGSYGWHFDRSDNIIYVLRGQKRFRVAGREPRSQCQLDAHMKQGDAIYVPRKLYHNGLGLAGGSTILSIALKPYRASSENRRRAWRQRRNKIRKFVAKKMFVESSEL